MGWKGIDIVQSGERIVVVHSLKKADLSALADAATGTSDNATLALLEVQPDGTVKTFDFADNTFKAGACTAPTAVMIHQRANNNTLDTGLWTYAQTNVAGFTLGGVYVSIVKHALASPPQQERKFQYGIQEGDQGDLYHADIQFTRDQANTRDEWTIAWGKNGFFLTAGITAAKIQVVRRSDGTDLIPATDLAGVGSTGLLKYDEATNRVTVGEAVVVIVTATIDGAQRTFKRVISRDST
jgi:hypothetical protein